jgi:hypothetical protein
MSWPTSQVADAAWRRRHVHRAAEPEPGMLYDIRGLRAPPDRQPDEPRPRCRPSTARSEPGHAGQQSTQAQIDERRHQSRAGGGRREVMRIFAEPGGDPCQRGPAFNRRCSSGWPSADHGQRRHRPAAFNGSRRATRPAPPHRLPRQQDQRRRQQQRQHVDPGWWAGARTATPASTAQRHGGLP